MGAQFIKSINGLCRLKLLILIMAFFVSFSAYGERTLRVVTSNLPPWEMSLRNEIQGIDIDIINELAKRLDLKVEYQMEPFSRSLESMAAGRYDLRGYLAKTEERENDLHFLPTAYQKDIKIFIVRRGNSDTIKKYDDLKSLMIGVEIGAKHFEPFDSDPYLNKSLLVEETQGYKMLLKNRVDAVVTNESEGLFYIHLLGLGKELTIAEFKVDLGYNGFLALSKSSTFMDRKEEFENTLKQMMDDGTVDKLIREGLSKYIRILLNLRKRQDQDSRIKIERHSGQ